MSSQRAADAGARGDRFERVAATVRERFGVDLAKYSRVVIGHVLEAAAEATSEAALARIVAACSIGETMFLRHPEHFALVVRLVDELGRRAPLRVWSAGCATGEEAYSLAAVLARLADVEVLGTDLNPASIEHARRARYRRWSMRGVRTPDVAQWLGDDGDEVIVRDHVREHVRFSVHNLVHDPYPRDVDIVFCRNVLMYFHDVSAQRVLRAMADSVRPGGALVLGHFDPAPARGGPWREQSLGGARVLRTAGARAIGASTVPPPGRRPTRPPPDARRHLDEGLGLARALADGGDARGALRVLGAMTAERPLEIEPHVLAAMIADEAGDVDIALAAARRARFLAPDDPVALYLLGASLERAGDRARGLEHVRRARAALDLVADPAGALPFGDGLTGLQLRRMIDVRLARS